MYSEDIAAAFVALLHSDVEGPVNIASGRPARVRDLVEALGAASGHPELVHLGALAAAPGEPAELTADVERLHYEVGWGPPPTLEQRANDTIAWWHTELMGDGESQALA
jgi:nucleoside-diphosphate-sugar epimerase